MVDGQVGRGGRAFESELEFLVDVEAFCQALDRVRSSSNYTPLKEREQAIQKEAPRMSLVS